MSICICGFSEWQQIGVTGGCMTHFLLSIYPIWCFLNNLLQISSVSQCSRCSRFHRVWRTNLYPTRLSSQSTECEALLGFCEEIAVLLFFSCFLALNFISRVLQRQLLQIQLCAAFSLLQTGEERTHRPQQRVRSEYIVAQKGGLGIIPAS